MASIALRIRLSSTCCICTLSASTRSLAAIELELDPDALILGADQRQRACFLDDLGNALDAPLALAARDEVAQTPDDLAGAQRLLRGFVDAPRGSWRTSSSARSASSRREPFM